MRRHRALWAVTSQDQISTSHWPLHHVYHRDSWQHPPALDISIIILQLKYAGHSPSSKVTKVSFHDVPPDSSRHFHIQIIILKASTPLHQRGATF